MKSPQHVEMIENSSVVAVNPYFKHKRDFTAKKKSSGDLLSSRLAVGSGSDETIKLASSLPPITKSGSRDKIDSGAYQSLSRAKTSAADSPRVRDKGSAYSVVSKPKPRSENKDSELYSSHLTKTASDPLRRTRK